MPQKQISFRSVNVEDGLSQNSVVSIAQDSIGYLWFATQDGLNRYDGKTFKYYNKQFDDVTRPNYSRLGKVYVDPQGNLWIISASGTLEKFDSASDTFIAQSQFKNTSSIFQNSNGDLYIGTFGEGLYEIKNKKDTLRLFKSRIGNRKIFNIYESANKTYALTSKGLLEMDADSISIHREDIPFGSVAIAEDNEFWLGSFGKGLFFMDRIENEIKNFSGFDERKQLPIDLNIQSLLFDSHDRLWVATYGNGAYLVDFSQKTIKQFMAKKTNPYAIHYNDVLCLFEDFTGTIWLGTDGAGLSYYDENLSKFNVLTNNQTPQDVNVDVIRAITVDAQNTIWMGTSGKGLTSYNRVQDTYKTFTTSNSQINSNRVMSLMNDGNKLYIGFQGSGLNILENGSFKSIVDLNGYTIWKIYKDSGNRIWLCTRENGLLQFDGSKGVVASYNTDNSAMPSNNIRTMEEGKDGALWVGTDSNGLWSIDPSDLSVSSISKVGDNIKSLHYDKNEILWIGTNGNGLKAYDPEKKSVMTIERNDGLPNNVIYSILPDDQGHLWLSSNRGLTKVSVSEESFSIIINYDNYDGLQALEFNTGAYFKDSKGYLYFGGLEGLNWFKPDALTKNPIPPKTVINKLEVFSEEEAIVQEAEYMYNQNTMTFSFAGLHFSLPERNNYKYKLIPYDEDWIDAANSNTSHYPKLPSGKYEFQVKSSNYDDVWNEEPATYRFTIQQPWYLNTIAKFIYALLILFCGFLVYRYLKWRWQMTMQLKLEHDETERLKKLDEVKSRLYTNISHEFRTPLTLISGPIDKQLSKPDLNEEDKKELSLVQRNAKRLLNLVNQMLDLSKLESGSLKLSVSKGNLSALLRQIIAVFEFRAEEKDIDFTYSIIDAKAAWFDRDIVEKVVTNLLGNAIKYAPEGGQVAFETSVQDGQLVITVINNGNSISNDALGKLFQRFYQTDNSSDGVGIGLSLVKELAILSHGNIVAHTMNDDDIQFTVTLPIERSFYSQTEIVYEDNMDLADTNLQKDIADIISETRPSEESPLLLIIEDNADVRHYIMSIFADEYKLIEATNGKIGMEKAIDYIPDLIISDIMMPISDGIEVCNTLKQDERTSHIPIILLTAKVGEEFEIQGLKMGADDYVTKPFSSQKLQIRVKKLIELRRQLQQRYSHDMEMSPKSLSNSPVDQKFMERLQGLLDEHLIDPSFNSESLGKKMLLSRMQLHRKLKAMIGLSTSELLRSQRLKMAIKLLVESDRNVSEIAYDVGFNTPSYFIKCFKASYNCTPSEYLEKT